MENYNYKVVAKLKSDLSEEDRKFIEEKISELMEKTGVENIGAIHFVKSCRF